MVYTLFDTLIVHATPLRILQLTVIQGFCADAWLNKELMWWVVLLYAPRDNPLTHQPILIQPRFKFLR